MEHAARTSQINGSWREDALSTSASRSRGPRDGRARAHTHHGLRPELCLVSLLFFSLPGHETRKFFFFFFFSPVSLPFPPPSPIYHMAELE